MRSKTIAAAVIGGSLLAGGLTLTTGAAWAAEQTPTLRIVTTEEPVAATTGGWDCPEGGASQSGTDL